jgi:type II secretory ATPase GspE/PulE/Tfp pilus assembly ATPase PilB-like protein
MDILTPRNEVAETPVLQADRRKTARNFPAADCPSTFTTDGRTYTVLMKDVSQFGAGFRLAGGEPPRLTAGAELTMTITAQQSATTRRMCVAWAKMRDGAYCFGAKFVDIEGDIARPALLNMDQVRIDVACALRVPAALAMRRQVLPFAALDGQVYVACVDPSDAMALEAVQRFTGQGIVVTRADADSLKRALLRVYGDAPRTGTRTGSGGLEINPEDSVSLSAELLHAAIVRQASDIHIEPGRDYLRVRFRIDGVLEEHQRMPVACEAGLVSRLKVLAGMDISEKRAPQDGAFTHHYGSGSNMRVVDIRAATLPTKYGEKMTLRLLGMQIDSLSLETLGMSSQNLACVQQVLDQPHGLMLLTGPTGSGKTTTLYASIHKLLKSAELNIITIEDPIEYDIPGISQVEVDSAEKVSFNKALRSVLRHDPDVLMIGEIRDFDTLDVAVKSALTGHLVLSTLHTNSAASAVTRLTDMGLAPYLIAATLRLSVAQRLVRKLCIHCRVARPLAESEARILGWQDAIGRTVFAPGKCMYCAGRGYSGRIGLFETLPLNDELRTKVADGVSEAELLATMKSNGVRSLLEDAGEKVFAGLTTIREVTQTVTTC